MSRVRGMIVTGTAAARRISSRVYGSRGQAKLWGPVMLHWRRTPRLRSSPPARALPGSWISIFAPRIVLHFSSNLNAVSKSKSFAAANPVFRQELIRRERTLHHREKLREHVSRERTFLRTRERYSPAPRTEFALLARPQSRADSGSAAGASPQVHYARGASVTTRFAVLTTRVARHFANHEHYSAASLVTVLAPAAARSGAPPTGVRPAEPSRDIFRTELVWRQPQAATKPETHDILPELSNEPRRSRLAASEPMDVNLAAVKSATHPAALDAAQMDRLVEHVIQRVDKRVRIERERRGW